MKCLPLTSFVVSSLKQHLQKINFRDFKATELCLDLTGHGHVTDLKVGYLRQQKRTGCLLSMSHRSE